MSKTLFEHVRRDDYLKPYIESRVDDFKKKLTERLDSGKFQVNSYMDGKFDFILLGEDLIKNLGVKYASGVTPKDWKYYDMIVEGRPNDKDEVIDKYLNVNLIFDISTKNNRRGTLVKRSCALDGREIVYLHTNPFL